MEQQIQQAALALQVLHDVSQQLLHDNCPQMLEKGEFHLLTFQVWMEWRYRVWGATHEAILKPSSEAQNSFWIKSRTGEDMGQFSAGPIYKAVPSFTGI